MASEIEKLLCSDVAEICEKIRGVTYDIKSLYKYAIENPEVSDAMVGKIGNLYSRAERLAKLCTSILEVCVK